MEVAEDEVQVSGPPALPTIVVALPGVDAVPDPVHPGVEVEDVPPVSGQEQQTGVQGTQPGDQD